MTPLLLMGCSQVKRPATEPVPFVDLYDGPIWKQVRAGYPHERIAVLSAKHGVLPPLAEIEAYDECMDEEQLVALINNGHEFAKLVQLIEANDKVIVLGSELYKLLTLALLSTRIDLIDRVHFVCGSYLQQRAAVTHICKSVVPH